MPVALLYLIEKQLGDGHSFLESDEADLGPDLHDEVVDVDSLHDLVPSFGHELFSLERWQLLHAQILCFLLEEVVD